MYVHMYVDKYSNVSLRNNTTDSESVADREIISIMSSEYSTCNNKLNYE